MEGEGPEEGLSGEFMEVVIVLGICRIAFIGRIVPAKSAGSQWISQSQGHVVCNY